MKDRLSIIIIPLSKLKHNKINDSLVWNDGWDIKFIKHVFISVRKKHAK